MTRTLSWMAAAAFAALSIGPALAASATPMRAHWAAANPLPDLESWGRIADVDARLRVALEDL